MRLALALALSIVLAAPAWAGDEETSSSRSVITVDGRTIEVIGGNGSSVTSRDGVVVIRSNDQEVRVHGNKIEIKGRKHDLPEYKHLTIKTGKKSVKVDVDGRDLDEILEETGQAVAEAGEAMDEADEALKEAAGALDEASKVLEGLGMGPDALKDAGKDAGAGDHPESAGPPDKEDLFPVDQVKTIRLEGLHESYRVEIDPKAKDVAVQRRKGTVGITPTWADGTLTVKGSGIGQARVTVVAPPGFALQVTGCRGGKIGDFGGALTLSTLGSESVKVGKVASADLQSSGSGRIVVAAIDGGDLKVDILGSGGVEIAGGKVREGRLAISGSGNLVCRATIAKAWLSILGSGRMKVAPPTEVVEKKVLGNGSIEILK